MSEYDSTPPPNQTFFPCNGSNITLLQKYLVNESLDCDTLFHDFLSAKNLLFGEIFIARVFVTWMLFILSFIGNSSVLCSVTFWRKDQEMSHTQLQILHLSVANMAFTIFVFPMDAIWNFTLEWFGGDFLCRVLNMFKQFSLYISSSMITIMATERVMGLLLTYSGNQRERLKKMLIFAWCFSLLNSVPANFIFSEKKISVLECGCPEHFITQCIDFKYWSKEHLRIFYMYSMCISFFIPLICVIVCYIIVAISLGKMSKAAKVTQMQSSGFRSQPHRKSLTRRSLEKARRVSQMVTGLITAIFIVSWGPYYFSGLIHWFEHETPEQTVMVIMLMSLYLNPVFQPLIAIVLMPDLRENIYCKISCTIKCNNNGKLPESKMTSSLKKHKLLNDNTLTTSSASLSKIQGIRDVSLATQKSTLTQEL